MCECGAEVTRHKRLGQCCRCYSRERMRLWRAAHPREPKPRPQAPRMPRTAPCSYITAHWRLREFRGRAAAHLCLDCGQQAAEWSYRGDSAHDQEGWVTKGSKRAPSYMHWSPIIWDYDPLCTICHDKRDGQYNPSDWRHRRKLRLQRDAS